MDEQHVYHHNDSTPRIDMKVERNSRGYNYEAKVAGAASVDEAMKLLGEAETALKKRYGTQEKAEE
jgi:hypothetical protein